MNEDGEKQDFQVTQKETTRLCPYILETTRLCPDMFVPRHVCAQTHLCPDMLLSCGHNHVWTETCSFLPRQVCAQLHIWCPDMV